MELNMIKARDWCLLAGALSLCLLAHAQDSTLPPRQIAPPKRIPEVVPGATLDNAQLAGAPVTTASMPGAVRRAVVADAARRFQVTEDAVVLASAEQVTWGDGSLGCPEPGRSYTQNLVPGFRVTATTVAGRMLYHADMRGNVVTCGFPVRPSQKSADERARGTGSEPRTQPPVRDAPDR
jgi:hypothetical protein